MGQPSSHSVQAWEDSVVIPTYPAPAPDRNPMFLDKRVYQGSSGKVYPNPFTDRLSDYRVDKEYKAVHLENEYVRLMILPEVGGRIHIGQDKTNGYDFFYRQNVIKPALVGLLGPWISGGVEFNWPQHHRPSTYMPVEHSIEEHADGSCTVWLSEHEPMNRMKGAVGICLHPGKSIIEAKVRLYNRTPFVQTFLWWANVGIRVHDQYQAFFPPDVSFVADHAKRAMSRYPVARNFYYGVDYSAGVDIAWYKNIPVPTSYMVTRSNYDFFGGYDHSRQAGVVHIANHHISPGKKLWTWGNADFGYAWDRELTDSDGPYIELMAGVFTDNQPDFSWLQPYETRTFRQFWYPIQEIGPAKNANRLLAMNLEEIDDGWRVGVCGTEELQGLRVVVAAGEKPLLDRRVDVRPGRPFVEPLRTEHRVEPREISLTIFGPSGDEIIRYRTELQAAEELPPPATEPPPPAQIESSEELYLTGLHLEQYRHATRAPEPYWEEALRRDPQDARSNNALGLLKLRRGLFDEAARHFRTAISRLTLRNPNPRDGECYFNLGVTLKFIGDFDGAYAAFYKAAWNQAWASAAYYQLACLDCARAEYDLALDHLDLSLKTNAENPKATILKSRILSRCDEFVDRQAPFDAHACLDLAFDCMEAGLREDASQLLRAHSSDRSPMILYTLGFLAAGREEATCWYDQAAAASPDYCFPARLEEMLVLQAALAANPSDARAHYYLGNLLYDKMRRTEAIAHWEKSCALDPTFAIPWRNLGIACCNVLHDETRALSCYEAARKADPSDARILYELDQLRKRAGLEPRTRLDQLESARDLVDQRDDLTVELVTLYNQTGQSQRALDLLSHRRFHPWEGGEGLVSGQYVIAHILLGCSLLDTEQPREALEHFTSARSYPRSLGEGKHLLTLETHLDYLSGLTLSRLAKPEEAEAAWRLAARANCPGTMFAYYKALALRQLGQETEAAKTLDDLAAYADGQIRTEVKIDYFATSLPNFLLFDDDLQKRNQVDCLFLRGLARLGLGMLTEGAADLRQVLALDRNHIWAQLELSRAEVTA